MELLAWLEQSAPVEALKRSFWVYPLVNAAHILAIGGLVTTVLLMHARLFGAFAAIDRSAFVAGLRRVALGCFAAAIATGLLLFSVRAGEYVVHRAFQLKMALLLTACLNFLLFARLTAVGNETTPPARALAMVSALLWLGVLVCGRFIGFL